MNRYKPRAVPALPVLALLTVLALAGLALTGTAQADPMRPLVPPAKAPAAASAPVVRAAQPADTPRPLGRLVAIRQDSQGRMQALIGERWVGVGDTLEHAAVTAIAPNQVDLKIGKARSTLHLLPPLQASSEAGAGQPPERAVLALHDRAAIATATTATTTTTATPAAPATTTATAPAARPAGSLNR